MTFCSDVLVHVKRIVKWRLNQVEPTENETKKMNESLLLEKNQVMRAFLAWRHTNLLVALPITLFSAIWDLVLMGQVLTPEVLEVFNNLGKFLLVVPYFSSLVLFLTVFATNFWWTNWRRTRLVVKAGWAASFFLPFFPAIFPIETLLTPDVLDAMYSTEENIVQLMGIKVGFAMSYVFVVLPLVITFPGGAVRAAVRIRGLLPQYSLSTWILVISAPFYSLLILMSLVVVLQLFGNALLIIGALLLTLNPWIYVYFRHLYLSSATEQQEKKLDLVQRCSGISNLLGFILVFIWALSSGVIGEKITTGELVRFLFVGFGNGLITSIVFCDAFLRMTITNWKKDKEVRDNDNNGDIDELFGIIERSIRKPSYKDKEEAGESSQPPMSSSQKTAKPEDDAEVGVTNKRVDATMNESFSSPSEGDDNGDDDVNDHHLNEATPESLPAKF